MMVKLTVGPLFIERNAYKNPDARTQEIGTFCNKKRKNLIWYMKWVFFRYIPYIQSGRHQALEMSQKKGTTY